MSNTTYRIEVRKETLFVNEKEINLEYGVVDAFQNDQKIIVLFDSDFKIEAYGQFANLIAIDVTGNNIWTAQLPTTETGDTYYKIVSRNPLIAYSVCSYSCEIDVATGQILKKEFYK